MLGAGIAALTFHQLRLFWFSIGYALPGNPLGGAVAAVWASVLGFK
jgi:hypothetical protein